MRPLIGCKGDWCLPLLLLLLAAAPGVVADEGACVSNEQRAEIERALGENVSRLRLAGALAEPVEMSVLLGWPLRAANGLADDGFDQIANFVDHDLAAPNQLLDYDCGDRTYDEIDGIINNHRGTDIQIWPFPWLKMANDEVEVVAAAAGTIVLKQDGFYDKNCSCLGTWNAVYVSHADGSVAWYGHLKKNSLTSKGLGASVAAGEYLGVVGSSGCSAGPHLHFELHEAGGSLRDPFAGPCNSLNANSWWLAQRPYHDSRVLKITTGLAPAVYSAGCGELEQPNEQSILPLGHNVYFTVYYRDPVAGQVATYAILRPNESVYDTWDYEFPLTWSVVPQVAQRSFSTFAPSGTWRFTVDYEGVHTEKQFMLGVEPAGGATLLTVDKTPTGVALTWDDSCGSPSPQAGIHIGLIGNYYSHFALGCDYSGGAAELTWLQVQGPRYLLVVPKSSNREGSYGQDSQGTERPPSTSPCEAQEIACP